MIEGEKDWVYGVKYNGRMVYSGDRLPVDSRITLQVGSGSYDDFSDSLEVVDPMSGTPEESIPQTTENSDLSDFEF